MVTISKPCDLAMLLPSYPSSICSKLILSGGVPPSSGGYSPLTFCRLLHQCCSNGAYTGVELVDEDTAASDMVQRFTDMRLDDIGER